MPEEKPLISTSYLTTREDYVAFRQAVSREKVSPTQRNLTRLVGLLFVVDGALLLLLKRGGAYDMLAWCALVLVGLFTFSYFDVLKPDLVRRQAKTTFDHDRRILVAQSLALSEEGLIISTDRYEASLPYSLLYRCVEDQNLFLFYTGMDEVRFVPKRVLTEEEINRLRTLLEQKLKERLIKR